MILNLNTKLDLPIPIQTEAHLALPINGRNGLCASFYHPDQLDIDSLNYATQSINNNSMKSFYAADIGCSPYFPQAIRFAQLGVFVDAFDIEPPIREYGAINQEQNNKINYVQTNLKVPLTPRAYRYSIVYSNRFISHITFNEANSLLQYFINHAHVGCRFYISFGLLEQFKPEHYADYYKPIQDRYSKVLNDIAIMHQLTAPLCLYSKNDIYNKLLNNYPIKILGELTGSQSIKIIFSKVS